MTYQMLYPAALIILCLLYLYQYFLFQKRGNSAKGGSLSFAVFYAMLAFFTYRRFENLGFLLVLFPAISLLVTIMQWREGDNPQWLQLFLLLLSTTALAAGIYAL